MNFYKHIVFDLDDTLLDTSGSLIPAAARRAIDTMISAVHPDSPVTREEQLLWFTKRNEVLRKDPRADVWLHLAGGDEEIADIGRRAFFTHPLDEVPDEAMRMTSGAFEILNWSQTHATLHLVTSGDAATQTKKIERLGIAHYFESIQIVDATNSLGDPTRKKKAFQKIADRFPAIEAAAFLSIGNRVDTDLGAAKILGWKTIWIRYGEHASLTPHKPEEIPDFELATLADLHSIWRQQFGLDDRWKT